MWKNDSNPQRLMSFISIKVLHRSAGWWWCPKACHSFI